MDIKIFPNPIALGQAAGAYAVERIQGRLRTKTEVNLVLATGTSQFETLRYLTDSEKLDWERIRVFHLDEYIGLKATHPASFRNYLNKRVYQKHPKIRHFHFIEGDSENPWEECERLGELIQQFPADLALIGIGENGHLAFNDPPADLETTKPFIVVELDEACRRQQMGEGWFSSFESVPQRAISMSISQIMKSTSLIVSVPDTRKTVAVKNAVQGDIHPGNPAAILQNHPDCHLFLDSNSASKL